MRRALCVIALAMFAGCAAEPAGPAVDAPAEPDAADTEPAGPMAIGEFERRWTAVLRGRVDRNGRVDYAAMAEQADELRALVKAVGEKRTIDDAAARLATLVNAYNLLVVAGVVEHRPTDTVRDVPGFFDKTKHAVLGESVTLDDLRDRMIRPIGDARVHAALCGGAVGSGLLADEAYTAARLDERLTERAIRFVNSRSHNAAVNGVLMASAMFRWFADDFARDPFGGPAGFCKLYAEPDGAIDVLMRTAGEGGPAVEYLEFNWSLNAKR